MTSLRREIDLVDDSLLILLNERQALVRLIGKMKKRAGAPIDDLARERTILSRRIALIDRTVLDETLIRTIYAGIFRHSREIQKG
ncbi:MAG TPA: chorismate mutase [Bacteroidota bacterium]|nr:chorismate mutase [Bacteroidota bacterium]